MKLHSKIQYDNENITFFNTNIFDSSLVPFISRGILKRYPIPSPQKIYQIKISFINFYLENDIKNQIKSKHCLVWLAFILKCVLKKLSIRKMKAFKEKKEEEKQQQTNRRATTRDIFKLACR